MLFTLLQWLAWWSRSKIENIGSVIDKSEGATEVDWAKASVLSPSASVSNQTRRLVEWNTESLLRLLQHVVASRGSSKQTKSAGAKKLLPTHAPLEEVVEVIALPQFNLKTACNRVDPETIDLGPAVKEQLYSYISWVASAYKTNPFHNFEHARYVPAFKPMLMWFEQSFRISHFSLLRKRCQTDQLNVVMCPCPWISFSVASLHLRMWIAWKIARKTLRYMIILTVSSHTETSGLSL